MEGSTSNYIPDEDEILPVSEENIENVNNAQNEPNGQIAAEDEDEQCQLLLNISIDKIDSSDSLNTETESHSSNSSLYQMTLMEKFNFIATRMLYSKSFQYYYFFVIILSIISLVLSYFLECTNELYFFLESLIIFALLAEITIRLLAQRKYYFRSIWNILDLIILANCIWLYYITKTKCPLNNNDSIIDSGILVVRYLIQFIRLGILLRKNKTSGTNNKRISVNFSHISGGTNYGSFNPTSHHKRRKRKNKSSEEEDNAENEDGEDNDEEETEDEEDENESESEYNNISNIINQRIFNPYGAIEDPRVNRIYGNSVHNESLLGPNTLSRSLTKEYASYLQGSQGSIDINIDSNANIAKIFYRDDINGDIDNTSKKNLSYSINSLNNDLYQKLIQSNIEDNSKNYINSGLPHPNSLDSQFIASSHHHNTNGVAHSYDSLSTNPINTPTSSNFSPSPSYPRKYQIQSSQKSFSPDLSFTFSLPPKADKKSNHRIAQINHSSTYNEIPNKVNLLTPILYGSPNTLSSSNN